jgi:hypothetical protein
MDAILKDVERKPVRPASNVPYDDALLFDQRLWTIREARTLLSTLTCYTRELVRLRHAPIIAERVERKRLLEESIAPWCIADEHRYDDVDSDDDTFRPCAGTRGLEKGMVSIAAGVDVPVSYDDESKVRYIVGTYTNRLMMGFECPSKDECNECLARDELVYTLESEDTCNDGLSDLLLIDKQGDESKCHLTQTWNLSSWHLWGFEPNAMRFS